MPGSAALELLRGVQAGHLSPDEALHKLRWQPVENVGDFAELDLHRMLRQGMPEFIYGASKTPEQTVEIFESLVAKSGFALASRITPRHYEAVKARVPQAIHHSAARLITFGSLPVAHPGHALVVAAGTSDYPVAEEAAVTLRFLGNSTSALYDLGVAGIHRLLAHAHTLAEADVLIVVAGMEGSLPTVVSGLVGSPVIAVPTSVGYGANLSGLAPLLGMLSSCATGMTVVNIDNGLGAAAAAHRILMRLRQFSVVPTSS